jgi:hypothetical protein
MVSILSIFAPFKRGHFNFAQRGLYYFALTQQRLNIAEIGGILYNPARLMEQTPP